MRFFCYVFRVWALPPNNLRSEVFGLRLSQQQLETISKIWDALDGRREVERTTREDSSRSSSSQESGYRSECSTSPLHRSSFEEGLSGEIDSFQVSPHMAVRVTEWLFALSCQFVAQIARPGEEQTLKTSMQLRILAEYAKNVHAPIGRRVGRVVFRRNTRNMSVYDPNLNLTENIISSNFELYTLPLPGYTQPRCNIVRFHL
jgi:hypothetical protein